MKIASLRAKPLSCFRFACFRSRPIATCPRIWPRRTKVTLIMIKLVRILKPRAVGLAIAHHAPAVMHIARNRARSDHRGPREQLPTLRQRGLARLANSTAGPKVSIRAGRGVVG
jgi:hypothetical protein